MSKSLTVSQLLGRGSSHWETRSHRPWSPSHCGARAGRKSLGAQGCLEGNTWPFQGGLVGRWGKVFAWHWAGPSPVRERGRGAFWREQHFWQEGHPLQNLGSNRAAGLFSSQMGPQFPQFFPRALQPMEDLAGVCWERHHIYYEAGQGSDVPTIL